MIRPKVDISHLTIDERIALMRDIWESLAAEPALPGRYSAEDIAEIDRRLKAYERNPGSAIPWEEVRAGLVKIVERGA